MNKDLDRRFESSPGTRRLFSSRLMMSRPVSGAILTGSFLKLFLFFLVSGRLIAAHPARDSKRGDVLGNFGPVSNRDSNLEHEATVARMSRFYRHEARPC